MKIFSKLSDGLFKLLKFILVLIFILALCYIVKWRIDKLYITELAGSDIEFSMKDEYHKVIKDIRMIVKKDEMQEVVTPQALLDEEEDSDIINIAIPEDATVPEIGKILLEKELMTDENAFEALVYNMGVENKFSAGSFEIEKGTKIRDTILILTGLENHLYEIEIMPGAAGDAVGEKLEKLGVIESGAEFAKNAREYGVFYKFKPGEYQIEKPIRVKVLIEQLTNGSMK